MRSDGARRVTRPFRGAPGAFGLGAISRPQKRLLASALLCLTTGLAGCAPMSLAQSPHNSLVAERCRSVGPGSEYRACVERARLDQKRYDEEASDTLRRMR